MARKNGRERLVAAQPASVRSVRSAHCASASAATGTASAAEALATAKGQPIIPHLPVAGQASDWQLYLSWHTGSSDQLRG